MTLDINLVKDKVKISDSFPALCRNLGLEPNKGHVRSNIERYCKRHNIDCNHFRTVKMIKDSKDRWKYDKLKILVEKCNSLKEILLELDLLPITTNYRKIKSVLEKYNLDFVYQSNNYQNRNLKKKYTEPELRKIVENSHTYKECFDKLGIRSAGSNYQHLKKYIEKYEIDISHFDQYYNHGNRDSKSKIDLTSILKENSKYNRNNLKKRLYDEQLLKRECCLCGQDENWNGMKISLILDHINGVYDDNRLENLRIVCPNCNAGLDTFAGKNIKKEKKTLLCECGNAKSRGSTICEECFRKKRRKVGRPSLEELKKEVDDFGYSATGRKYGVSDNAIRKWLKYYEHIS
jgi:hypothetical protein